MQCDADISTEVARYRALAEECRARASQARHASDQNAWLALADEWQVLAQSGPTGLVLPVHLTDGDDQVGPFYNFDQLI
ncbi:hypothetical protein ACVWXM_006303 [Bradyrhizobium sp. GM7.3]